MSHNEHHEIIVGIDLGTTYSEVAALVGDRPGVLGPGTKMLPSCVGISTQGQLLIGEAARNQLLVYPELTVRSIKRKMGTDERFELGDKSFTPPEISALILRELVQWAGQELNTEVRKAIITVPAYFSDAQRQATREAGQLAGLEVVRILNEPTAASLAYGFGDDTHRTAMVYDLGGGTFDVSIVSIEGDVTEVLASHGNNQLGGDDFDQLILDTLLREFESQHQVDLRDRNPISYARLRWAAEEAKKRLSIEQYVRVREEALAVTDGKPLHLDMELSRQEYEAMIRPLVDSTLESVFQAMEDASKAPEDIDVIVLVGGSTRTPLVREMLEEHVRATVRQDVHPDLCVALGSGLLASRLAGHSVERVLVDISPYSFGPSYLGTRDGELYPYCYRPIIKRNTPLPVTRVERYFTSRPYQEAVEISVFQGDDPDALKNILVGNFMVEGLAPVAEENEVLCRMSLDLDGILKVEAIEKRTGLAKHILIKDAIKPKSQAELARAQARLQRLYAGREDSAIEARWEEGARTPPGPELDMTERLEPTLAAQAEMADEIAAAQRLIDRSRQLLAAVHDEDKEEIIDLHEKIQGAIDALDRETLSDGVGALRELLFFIEGK